MYQKECWILLISREKQVSDDVEVYFNIIASKFQVHRASLLSVTFINQLMHSIITVVDVKVYVI